MVSAMNVLRLSSGLIWLVRVEGYAAASQCQTTKMSTYDLLRNVLSLPLTGLIPQLTSIFLRQQLSLRILVCFRAAAIERLKSAFSLLCLSVGLLTKD